jgi:mycothiol synthase
MAIDAVEIVRCPAEFRAEALALVLCELAPTLRTVVAGELLETEIGTESGEESLFIARRAAEICGAAWGQWQSGNIVVFWPPQLVAGEDAQTAYALAEAVAGSIDATPAEMMQVFLSAPAAETIRVLKHIGFRHIADLRYMTAEFPRFPLTAPPGELQYVPYDETQRARLLELVARTYEGTLDCSELDGVRDLDHVIDGYQRTGVFRPENWLFVRGDGRDVGVLLLADHPQGRHWELMYTALVPEARGRGWGRQVTRYAQWLGRTANIERIVVAVDAANWPAVAMYRDSGFEMWDQRAVYVRVPAARGADIPVCQKN